jgi:putative ABC transport system substrate-binding protein
MADRLRGFRQGLKDAGFVEGENVAIVYRWAENQINRLPALAAELVRRQVAVLVATGGPSSALTAPSGLVRALMIASTEGLMALLAWMQTVQRNQPRRRLCLHH